MKAILTPADYKRAAAALGCEVAIIRAVAEKESDGGGFLKRQLLVVRFEGHIFQRLTRGKFNKTHPTLSHAYMRKCPFNKGTISDWRRLEQARQLAGDVAFECASYGMFQIMGFHYALLGYKSAYDLVQAFNQGEGTQLDAFVRYIQKQGLADALRERRLQAFADAYNGTDSAANNYGPDLLALYEHYRTLD
ncbi:MULTISPECIES: N-acetylmuramidase family protein [Spirosoma]|uniref:N-acetylmuramidase family protein n=1 Tax=Spirosoma sordidisoli TaxID=2502893 RepID=A0A4V1RWC8_9BACT|nr:MULTISPECIES: N-acetylmuramidase family protein [Spirosoma]RYC69818.1 N-acetylmuramidase family protein [Spirosoma sordidisoli]